MRKPPVFATVLWYIAVLRLCDAQSGVCYFTSSQVSTQSYYVQTSYTYYYDCSNLGWGWSYCAATGYTSSLTYASVTAYVAQFTCCTGYSQVGTTQTCADTNECASNGGLGPCQQNCTNTIGSFYCKCDPGYTLSGVFCNDINECAPNGGLGPCQQLCTNTIGSYYCSCQPGYALSADGTSCYDINECASNGGLGPCQQNCTNTIGSFVCNCQNGYSLSPDAKSCHDINECASNGGLGPCQQICVNKIGSFDCSCNPGYAISGHFCNDINECSSNGGLGPCQQNCTNTIGSFVCSCLNGYLVPDNNRSCQGPTIIAAASTMAGYKDPSITGYNVQTIVVGSIQNPIIPTAVLTSTDAIILSPIVLLKTVYVQVRILSVTNCGSWKVPAALKLLSQSVDDNVNELCKCNVSIANSEVICYNVSRVTLRGTVEAMQLPYLQDWVANEATNLDILGTLLKVDKSCPVQIQSFDDPECPVVSNVDAQQTVDNSGTIGFSAGLAIGGVTIVVVIAFAVIAALFITIKKRSGNHKFTNPLYNAPERIYDTPDYSTISQREMQRPATELNIQMPLATTSADNGNSQNEVLYFNTMK